MHDAISIVHSLEPPCSCDACLRATAIADRRKAEIETILRRLDEAEQAIALEVDK
jgi:hypothetical protein